ncbi:hypothetical protein FGB62_85g11 [Gracilaria domingensis]|nr:hypothetical protein FGB62_85g11 [Gracilaria domingensis]
MSASARQAERVDLVWKGLTFTVPVKLAKTPKSEIPTHLDDNDQFSAREKVILRSISGEARAGTMLAVMGSSGAGKTSLLNLLAGRVSTSKGAKATGAVYLNGEPRNYNKFRKLAAYVIQDDDMFAELTVQEQLTYAALLRLPASMPKEKKLMRVQKVIQELGLGKVKDTMIGNQIVRGISGGERKRVNIGTELVTNPSLLFLDEPTTGLDSFNALNVMTALRQLASNGRTIISTIHQPRSSIFALFDQLCLLSEGRVMYFGPAKEAVDYFSALNFRSPSQFNPADFFLDLLSIDPRSVEREANTQARVSYLGDMYAKQAKPIAIEATPDPEVGVNGEGDSVEKRAVQSGSKANVPGTRCEWGAFWTGAVLQYSARIDLAKQRTRGRSGKEAVSDGYSVLYFDQPGVWRGVCGDLWVPAGAKHCDERASVKYVSDKLLFPEQDCDGFASISGVQHAVLGDCVLDGGAETEGGSVFHLRADDFLDDGAGGVAFHRGVNHGRRRSDSCGYHPSVCDSGVAVRWVFHWQRGLGRLDCVGQVPVVHLLLVQCARTQRVYRATRGGGDSAAVQRSEHCGEPAGAVCVAGRVQIHRQIRGLRTAFTVNKRSVASRHIAARRRQPAAERRHLRRALRAVSLRGAHGAVAAVAAVAALPARASRAAAASLLPAAPTRAPSPRHAAQRVLSLRRAAPQAAHDHRAAAALRHAASQRHRAAALHARRHRRQRAAGRRHRRPEFPGLARRGAHAGQGLLCAHDCAAGRVGRLSAAPQRRVAAAANRARQRPGRGGRALGHAHRVSRREHGGARGVVFHARRQAAQGGGVQAHRGRAQDCAGGGVRARQRALQAQHCAPHRERLVRLLAHESREHARVCICAHRRRDAAVGARGHGQPAVQRVLRHPVVRARPRAVGAPGRLHAVRVVLQLGGQRRADAHPGHAHVARGRARRGARRHGVGGAPQRGRAHAAQRRGHDVQRAGVPRAARLSALSVARAESAAAAAALAQGRRPVGEARAQGGGLCGQGSTRQTGGGGHDWRHAEEPQAVSGAERGAQAAQAAMRVYNRDGSRRAREEGGQRREARDVAGERLRGGGGAGGFVCAGERDKVHKALQAGDDGHGLVDVQLRLELARDRNAARVGLAEEQLGALQQAALKQAGGVERVGDQALAVVVVHAHDDVQLEERGEAAQMRHQRGPHHHRQLRHPQPGARRLGVRGGDGGGGGGALGDGGLLHGGLAAAEERAALRGAAHGAQRDDVDARQPARLLGAVAQRGAAVAAVGGGGASGGARRAAAARRRARGGDGAAAAAARAEEEHNRGGGGRGRHDDGRQPQSGGRDAQRARERRDRARRERRQQRHRRRCRRAPPARRARARLVAAAPARARARAFSAAPPRAPPCARRGRRGHVRALARDRRDNCSPRRARDTLSAALPAAPGRRAPRAARRPPRAAYDTRRA